MSTYRITVDYAYISISMAGTKPKRSLGFGAHADITVNMNRTKVTGTSVLTFPKTNAK